MKFLINAISRVTCFSLAVALVSVATSSIAAGIGVFLIYLVMGSGYLEIFLDLITPLILLIGAAGAIHFILFGLIPGFQLNRLKLLNNSLYGSEFAPGLTSADLDNLIPALKRFPLLNTAMAGGLSLLVVLIMTVLGYLETKDLIICVNVLLSGGVAVLLYAVFTFIFTSAIIEKIRKNALRLQYAYKKKKRRF